MNARGFLIIFVGAVFISISAASAASDMADRWIVKARAYLGSESALSAVTSIHFNGVLEASGEVKIPAEIIFQKPFKQRIIYTGPKVIEITALDGYDAWVKRVDAQNPVRWQVQLLDASLVKRLRANSLENLSFYSAQELKDCNIEYRGEVSVNDIPCVRVSFTHSGGVSFVRFFEKTTGRLVKTETENGTEITEEGEYVVAGVRFPKRVVNRAPNGNVTAITFEKIVVNEKFPAEIFAVPALQAR